jgi:hypothetical protein
MNYTTYRGTKLAQPSTASILKRPGNIILALNVIGWISIVMAVVLTVYRLPNLTTGIGEATGVFAWASLFGAALGG